MIFRSKSNGIFVMSHFSPSNDLQSHIDYLERERWQLLSKEPHGSKKVLENEFFLIWGIAIAMIILLMITQWVWLLIPVIGIFAYMAFVFSRKEKQQDKITTDFLDEYRDFYKQNIIKPLLEAAGQDVVYHKNGSILDKHAELSGSNTI